MTGQMWVGKEEARIKEGSEVLGLVWFSYVLL